MTDFSDLRSATRAVMDPSTSGTDLASIAQAQPGLRPQVAMHANAYPGLLTWLATYGDDFTKRAVAARQQSSVSAVLVMPAPRKRKGWLIALVVAVVAIAVVIALAITRPWQQGGPQLSANQFIYLVMHNDEMHGTDYRQSSADELASRLGQNQGAYVNGYAAWLKATGNPDCYASVNGIQDAYWGYMGDGNAIYLGNSIYPIPILWDTAQHASIFLNASLTCGSYGDERDPTNQSTKIDGVMMYGFGIGYATGGGDNSMDWGFAQYGNVVFSYGQFFDPITWSQWQKQASLLKKAVDDAAKQ